MIKTLLFCTSYMKDANAWQKRYRRWLDYYLDGPINADKILMIDDGSPHLPPAATISTVSADSDIAERLLPFTSVNRQFKGDRGIFRSRKFNRLPIFPLDFFREPIPHDADFATQVVPRQKVAFRGA
jgi:hypothetical protein